MIELRRHIMSIKTDIEDDSLFYIESLEDGNEILLDDSTWMGTNIGHFFYSLNKNSWNPLPASVILNKNRKIYFTSSGENLQKNSSNSKPLFKSSLQVNIGGDIKGLLFPNNSPQKYGCMCLFLNCKIVNADKLVLPIVGNPYYFERMFYNCVLLEYAPEIPTECTTAQYMYRNMFNGCERLIKPPSYIGSGCMYCSHEGMFENCKSMTESPVITINYSTYSFRRMFKNCESLSKITCINSGNNSVASAFTDWVLGVPTTGLFLKRKGVEWSVGTNGIPDGWIIKDYEQQ